MNVIETWANEQDTKALPLSSERVVDLTFRIQLRELPVDHAQVLSQGILQYLPWIQAEPLAGIHLIHIAGSQNGWMKPEDPSASLYPSRRTRLRLRIPITRLDDAKELIGQTINLGGHELRIDAAEKRPVYSSAVLLSRHLIVEPGESETEFLQRILNEINQLGIRCRRLLPGRHVSLTLANGPVETCSLMAADLTPMDSITLQELGIGKGRHFGCGLFIPCKGLRV